MPEYRRIIESLDSYNLVVIHGPEGTGRTGFIRNYYSKFKNYSINYTDSTTSLKVLRTMIKNKEYYSNKKVIIYDDTKIKKELIDLAEKYISPTRGNVAFTVVVNKFKVQTKKFIVHRVDYPTKNELLYYLNKIGLNNEKLKLQLLKLKPKTLRRIEMSIEDGYVANEAQEDNEKYHVFNSNSYILSLAIAENLTRLKRFDELLCEMDKLKKNEKLYKDFVKLYYPSLDKMKLRYPKELLSIINNQRKNKS